MNFSVTGSSHLMNQSRGVIQVSNNLSLLFNNAGIRPGNPGNITNSCMINLDNCGNYGVWISDEAQLNHNDGLIALTNMPNDGFYAAGTSEISFQSPATLIKEMITDSPFSAEAGVTITILGAIDIIELKSSSSNSCKSQLV